MRVAQKGTVIVPVVVRESSPKMVRQGSPQYVAAISLPEYGLVGGGDTIEEAVDDCAQSL